MFKQIYKEIKKYDYIVIARHLRVDPDAHASAIALRESIKTTFPDKSVYAIGNGTIRFNYIGKLDKIPNIEEDKKVLLICLDTPDFKRVELLDFKSYDKVIKIDHHQFIENFGDIEIVEDTKSSTCEIIYDLIKATKLVMNEKIAEIIYAGIVSDTGRFLYNFDHRTIKCINDLIENYNVDYIKCYSNIYKRPYNELKLYSYMIDKMEITDYGVGYVKVTEEILNKYCIDSVSSGDLVNNFTNIDELLVWLTATEDVKNSCIRVSIRSRGPIINKIAEAHGGGGHKLAAGTRVPSFEEIDDIIKDLNNVCNEYIEERDKNED